MEYIICLQECPFGWCGQGDLCELYYADSVIRDLCNKERFKMFKVLTQMYEIQENYEDVVIEVPEEIKEGIMEYLRKEQGAYKIISTDVKDPFIDWKGVVKKFREEM